MRVGVGTIPVAVATGIGVMSTRVMSIGMPGTRVVSGFCVP